MFGTATSSATQKPGGLFGAGAAQQPAAQLGTTTQQQPTGMFGNAARSNSTGMFGNTARSSSAGMFGNTSSSQPSSGLALNTASKPSGGLFGSSNATQPSTSLFGNNAAKPSVGLFGNATAQQQPQPQVGMFGNSVTQPQLTQQPQTPGASVFQANGVQSIQPVQQPSRFEKYELKNVNKKTLFSSDNVGHSPSDLNLNSTYKKRTIPNHLIKRTNKVNNNASEEDKPSAPILPFKVSTQVQPDTFAEDFAYLYEHDKPPTTSIFDPSILHEDSSPGEIFMGESTFNKMNKNPINFHNIFQRPDRNFVSFHAKNHHDKSSLLPWQDGKGKESETTFGHQSLAEKATASTANKDSRLPQINKLYCSVIVYGFDDTNFPSLIEYFAKYGKIMEDLVISDSNYYYGSSGNVLAHDKLVDIDDSENANSINCSNSNTSYSAGYKNNKNGLNGTSDNYTLGRSFPIFLGHGWVKLTYDNPNSAVRALMDNLTDDGNGNILGVLPYRREDLELLLGEKIPDDLDVGNGLHGLSHELELENKLADNEIGRYLNNARGETSVSDNGETHNKTSSLKIKDGSNLLLKKQQVSDTKNLWHSGIEFLFGNGKI